MMTSSPSNPRLEHLHAFWQAATYLSVGQIYLRDNPLLREPFKPEQIKPRLLGHFGTCPGLTLIYAHLNRLIQDTDAPILLITGPGHGGPALLACAYLDGYLTECYPEYTLDSVGLGKLMQQFSWPGGFPSHVSPPMPGSIHEGGELGYSLVHAYGAAFDNPELIVTCIVGDGEAETGPLAASWQSLQFINPSRDGAVLPILHLNGYKISAPTVLGRQSNQQLAQHLSGFGYQVRFVEGDEPMHVHEALWQTLDWAYTTIRQIQHRARTEGVSTPGSWPLIILRTPKGWTAPKFLDGQPLENNFRAHQVPISDVVDNPDHFQMLADWLRSYQPDKHFDDQGRPRAEILSTLPRADRRISASPYANGGQLLKPLRLPNWADYAVSVSQPGHTHASATQQLGQWLAEVFRRNETQQNFRLFCPDELNSNRLDAVLEATDRLYLGDIMPGDAHLGPQGRVLEVLSEHCCQGWLEGYLLTGRHGLFPCYEAFALIVDSMVSQHAKWLKACGEIPWRQPIASLNYLLTSHAWRQDHNGYSHQGPGFLETVLRHKSHITRVYLPPDSNCLLAVAQRCLQSKNYINLMIAGKQSLPQWLDREAALAHCAQGASIWHWAGHQDQQPDVVLAAAGDTPTLETLAAAQLLRQYIPELRVRVVNVVDLGVLYPHTDHPHGFDDEGFNRLLTPDKPVIFAFHGHPRVIHELVHKRSQPSRFHVRGYIEEGTTTTPFDMVVCNGISRFQLAIAALQRSYSLRAQAGELIDYFQEQLKQHQRYIRQQGEDMPLIQNWQWQL